MPDVILKHVPGMATATPVPSFEADALSESAFMREYISQSRPCVIRGAVRHWPASKKWRDREYLKSLCHHQVTYLPHENHVSMKRTEVGMRTVPFGEAVDLIYSAQIAAFGTGAPSKLETDLGGFSFLTKGDPGFLYPAIRSFFFRNAGSSWHYHPFDETLMCQVREPKKVGLLNVRNPLHQHIRRIFLKEDYYEDPFAFEGIVSADLQWFSASLETGDALYIPPLWWHGVIATSNEVGVTIPVVWRSPNHVMVDSIRKMAAGEADLIGPINPIQRQNLFDFARNTGVVRELTAAWQRGETERLIVAPK